MPPTPFRVHVSGAVKEQMRDVVARAAARGQKAEALDGLRKLVSGLTWLADELGESRGPLKVWASCASRSAVRSASCSQSIGTSGRFTSGGSGCSALDRAIPLETARVDRV